MSNLKRDYFIDLLHKTHKAEWEASPRATDAISWLHNLLDFLFPNHQLNKVSLYQGLLKKSQADLENILLSYLNTKVVDVELVVTQFYDSLEDIYQSLRLDANYIYESDPAATSLYEVIVSYPGFFAIAVYRISNRLSQLGIPILPRIISEHAHGQTGVDIHPSASIGVPFFIDHATGIVIGATAIIGKFVSIYQGVTLGALQVNKERSAEKRHPTVEDHVVIYARSTILGGATIIGHHSIIGGSVFLTKSVDPYTHVFNTHKLRMESKHPETIK